MENVPAWVGTDPLMQEYMVNEWGREVYGEQPVFERLCLEVFQSGLSWLTILKKREAFREAFDGFDPEVVGRYGAADIVRLMGESAIVRNRRKIDAAITNARASVALRETGDLSELVWSYRLEESVQLDSEGMLPTQSTESAALAKDLKARGFAFVGPTNMYALMCAIGIVDVRGALGLPN
ncbi:MAG: DNA-3-methyladenine glycosylase I [Ancrocorticia sp.]|uniref:DNA-3-methyladenine glycosylase I n=1 Tax=Ancrocorticia sp. TaxID=2593684 RepID=UPI003F930244